MRVQTRRLFVLAAGAASLIAALTFLRQYLQRAAELSEQQTQTYARPTAEDDPLLLAFRAEFPGKKVLLACAADVTDNGCRDLVVICTEGDECSTIVYLDDKGNHTALPPVPAPREEQKIRFFNMDHSGALEILITGSKNGQVGYAVYRVMKGHLVNLFGEGMEDCC